MKTTLVGSLVTVVVSLVLMVDVPVKANDPKAKAHMVQPVNGHGAASKTMGHEELRNTMRMLGERCRKNADEIAMFLGGAKPKHRSR